MGAMVRMKVRRLGVLLLLGCGFAPVLTAQSVRSIEIESGWGGLGTPQHAVITIRREKGSYRRDADNIDPAQVHALVVALRAPAISKPSMENLGVTAAWLNAHLVNAEKRLPGKMEDALPSQIQLFEKSFEDPRVMGEAVASRFRYGSTDDYPSARVEVVFDDGSRLSAATHSYYAFMIPWTLKRDSGEDTFNADISRAVSALLPAEAPNKERLTGGGFDADLGEELMRQIENQWNMLGVEGRAGAALAALRKGYTIESADINPYHDVYFGRRWAAKGPHETNLQLWVRRDTFPRNLHEHVVLQYEGGLVPGVDTFLKNGQKYEALARGVPWLNAWLRQHPEETMTLAYVHNQSFGDHAMESFAADMKARGREDLIPLVRAQQGDIALLKIGFVYWILFPDHHMMLWRFEGPRGFLKWKAADFPAGECDEYYAVNNGGCSGREISAEGELLPDSAPRDVTCMAAWRTLHPARGPVPDALFTISEKGREGLIDRTGKIVLPPCFDGIADYADGLARFERDGLWGFIDSAGQVVIPPKYPWAEAFHEGLAWVQMKGKALEYDARWGVIDKAGKVIVAPTYKQMEGDDGEDEAFHEGLAMVQVGGDSGPPLYGYINATGKMVIAPRFTLAQPFEDGMAAATESGFSGTQLWGFIDKTGNWTIPPRFDWASNFSEGLAAVGRTHDCGYVNPTGAFALRPPVPEGEKDCHTVWGSFTNGLSRWRFGARYGYIDQHGKTVIAAAFDLTDGFSEGLAAVLVGGKWGYIDTTGAMVINPITLTSAGAFHGGLARVTTNNGYGYIDRTGKFVWGPARDTP